MVMITMMNTSTRLWHHLSWLLPRQMLTSQLCCEALKGMHQEDFERPDTWFWMYSDPTLQTASLPKYNSTFFLPHCCVCFTWQGPKTLESCSQPWQAPVLPRQGMKPQSIPVAGSGLVPSSHVLAGKPLYFAITAISGMSKLLTYSEIPRGSSSLWNVLQEI